MKTIPFHTPLTREQQLEAGLTEDWPMAMADKVRFGEIDVLGHVNNAAYLSWFETVRTRYVREWGLTGYDPKVDPRIVIRSGEIHYVKEMLRDEEYIVTARTSAYRNTSFTVDAELWSKDLRARFSCVLVTLEPDGSARRPLPKDFVARICDIDGAVSST